jgi:geranylgeranyl diphosphate synthase type I
MLARQLATPAQRALLDRAGTAIGEADVAELAETVAATGAVAEVEQMISDRVAVALAALDTAPIDETARSALTGLAAAAAHRRA